MNPKKQVITVLYEVASVLDTGRDFDLGPRGEHCHLPDRIHAAIKAARKLELPGKRISPAAAGAAMGSVTSKHKAKTSAKNGKLGGRPKKEAT